jgi:transcriptional regulator with XRE-family HTH domain
LIGEIAMIRFDLAKMTQRLEQKEKRKITLKEISEKSGCDKNALSRLVNHPDVIPSANLIDRLVQFFFNQLKTNDRKQDAELMSEIVKSFVCVFPDDEQYWEPIPKGIRNNLHVSLSDVWEIYSRGE